MLDFLFIGIGQCGNKFADAFSLSKNKAIAINTTLKDMTCLENIPKQNLIKIEAEGTKGGAGKVPNIGAKGMSQHIDEVMEKIKKIGENCDFLFLCTGLGGGTGSGATPVLLQHLLDNNYKNIGLILTTPSEDEGVEVQANAFDSYLKLLKIAKGTSDKINQIPILLIENNKIKAKMEKITEFDWRTVTYGLSKLITQFNIASNKNSPYSTFDESDYKKTLGFFGQFVICKTTINVNDINNENTLKEKILQDWKDNYYVDFDYKSTQIITSVIEAPNDFLDKKSNYKLLESSISQLENECGTVSPYRGIYPYNEQKETNRKNNIVIYTLLTGMAISQEKIQKMFSKAKSEVNALKEKRKANTALDLDAFDSFGSAFEDNDEKVSNNDTFNVFDSPNDFESMVKQFK